MVIASVAVGPLAANCYVLAPAAGSDCVIIDPGMDALSSIATVVEEQRLQPVAVLLTHGHFDHVADAAAVCDRYDAGWWAQPADRDWLDQPLDALSVDFHPLVTDYLDSHSRVELDREAVLDVELDADGAASTELAGIGFEFLAAPGHTPGSTLYRVDLDRHQLVFTGDVLFEGSIGRSDLPGGDPATMERTLTSTVLSLPDEAVVLPGHGRQTTIGRERTTNRFLRQFS